MINDSYFFNICIYIYYTRYIIIIIVTIIIIYTYIHTHTLNYDRSSHELRYIP